MKYLITLIVTVSIVIIYFSTKRFDELIITNQSTEIINNVSIIVSDSEKENILFLGTLYPKTIYTFQLTKSQDEKGIEIIYTDSNKKNHRVDVIPYLILGQFKNYEYEIK